MREVHQCNVDLFATRLNHQLPQFVSWRPDPFALGTDAMRIPRIGWRGYAFPPFVLISRILRKVREEKSMILLIAPVWESQPWYPALLFMLVDYPILLSDLLTDPFGHHPLLMEGQLQLAAWKLSGEVSQQKEEMDQLAYAAESGSPFMLCLPIPRLPSKSVLHRTASVQIYQHYDLLCP